jgi:NAD+ kinase
VPSVLLVVHPQRKEALPLAEQAEEWWAGRGYDVILAPSEPIRPDGSDAEPLPHGEGRLDGGGFDFAISLGGDGTMLRAVRLACAARTPVLGVNLGRMGYLTEVEPAGMIAAFERLSSGDYDVEERMTLEVVVDAVATGGRAAFVALNEATVERVGPGHTIRVAVDISGKRFLTYVADGLLVSTPTGSTAYNLSARGPVVSPRLMAMVFTAIAPHLVFDHSLVLGPAETVTFTLLPGRPATVVLDGARTFLLEEGDTVSCRGGRDHARLVLFGERDFHARLRSRFGLTDR